MNIKQANMFEIADVTNMQFMHNWGEPEWAHIDHALTTAYFLYACMYVCMYLGLAVA